MEIGFNGSHVGPSSSVEIDPVFNAWKTIELPVVYGGDTIRIVTDRPNLLFKWYVNDIFIKNIPWGWDQNAPSQVVDSNWTVIGSSEISTNLEVIYTGLNPENIKNYKFDFSGSLLNHQGVASLSLSIHSPDLSVEYLGWQIGSAYPYVSNHLYFNTTDSTALAVGLNYVASSNVTMLKSSDIGITVQPFNANTTTAGTSTDTPTILTANSGSPTASNQCTLQNDNTIAFTAEIVARDIGNGDSARWEAKGLIKRGANASTTTLVGTPTIAMTHNSAGAATWVIALSADTTNGALAITATGENGKTIKWLAKISTTSVM